MKGILRLKPWLYTVFLSPVSAFMMSAFSPGSTTQTQLLKPSSPNPASDSNSLNLLAMVIIFNDYNLIQMQEKYTKYVGSYKLTNRLLGKGSFSEVLLAYATDRRKLAVKVIPRQQISESAFASFESELQALRSIKHENIVELVDFKKSQNHFYLFLQYCEGGNLSDYIKSRRRLSEPEAIKIFTQIVRAVSAMHHSNLLHRDLKPANILLHNGRVKIADFGLACKFYKDEMLNIFAGTPLHMAPEILKRRLYNQKVDIYSAGTILYEMLYGDVPFKANDTKSLIEAIQMGKLALSNDKVSEKIRGLLSGMLKPEPEERIELEELVKCMNSFEGERKEELLENYKRLSKASADQMGVAGGLFCQFELQNHPPKRASDVEMRLYHRLCNKLTTQPILA